MNNIKGKKLFTDNVEMEINQARILYEGIGLTTLPLLPGEKSPAVSDWPWLDSAGMWKNAPKNANIGIRTGNGLAVIDCDDENRPYTFINAMNWLKGLGYSPDDYPTVITASGVGRHIYVSLSGKLPGNYRRLAAEFGVGEFRYGPGAFVVAPPSIVNNSSYSLMAGDFRQLPKVDIGDIQPIIGNPDLTIEASGHRKKIPRRVKALLKGYGLNHYRSRSEAEQSIIMALINAGFDFNDTLNIFINNPGAGKFAEKWKKNKQNAYFWLQHSYESAYKYAKNHESKTRQEIKKIINWAQAIPWPGITGSANRAVFTAHASIAYKAGSLTYAASSRSLAELAGVSHVTAAAATHRLCSLNYITVEKESIADSAPIYRICLDGHNLTLPNNLIVRKCKVMSAHDLFRRAGLGKTSAEIWEVLQRGPATSKQIAQATGRHKRTVERNLKQMANIVDVTTGEIISMVEQVNEKWRAHLGIDIDYLAQVVGTAGIGEKEREKHARERRAHHRALEWGRNHKMAGGGT